MQAAKKAGAATSFDLNYREKLWNIWGGSDKARSILGQIVSYTDVLVGNEEDLQKGLGIRGPEVKAVSALDPAVFLGMIDDVRAKFPSVKAVATAHVRAGCPGSRWRRGRLRVGLHLRTAQRSHARGSRQTRLGPRCPAHHDAGGHEHGHPGAGSGFRPRRLRPDPALTTAALLIGEGCQQIRSP